MCVCVCMHMYINILIINTYIYIYIYLYPLVDRDHSKNTPRLKWASLLTADPSSPTEDESWAALLAPAWTSLISVAKPCFAEKVMVSRINGWNKDLLTSIDERYLQMLLNNQLIFNGSINFIGRNITAVARLFVATATETWSFKHQSGPKSIFQRIVPCYIPMIQYPYLHACNYV